MKKIFLTLLIFTIICGCNEDFLDRVPYDGLSSSVIWDSDANAIMAVDGIYSTFAFKTWVDGWSGGPLYYITNLSPEGYTIVRTDFGLAHSTGTTTSASGNIRTMYTNFYRPIRYANEAIAGLSENKNVTLELANRLVGEAKFWRGLCYFYLWQLFGGVVILDRPIPVEETFLPRNSADEVKELIINDFTDAINRLPVSYEGSDYGRVTQGAAISMLGKVFLFDEQWGAAVAEFEKLLSSPFTYRLTDEFTDNFYFEKQNNSETVLDLQYIDLAGYGSAIDRYYGFRNHFPYGEDVASANQIGLEVFTNKDGTAIDLSSIPNINDYPNVNQYGTALTDWYQATFANADPRLHASIILPGSKFLGKGGVESKLYWPSRNRPSLDDPPEIITTFPDEAMMPIRKLVSRGEDSPTYLSSPVNWPLIRFADVLLMYAEAKNETSGPDDAVYNAINSIRTRAGIVELPSGLSKEEMRQNIRLERLRELMFECHSYFDVKRWKTAHTDDHFFGLNQDIYDFTYGKLFYKKVFDANRDYLWPIPLQEIDLNPKMEQNPGW